MPGIALGGVSSIVFPAPHPLQNGRRTRPTPPTLSEGDFKRVLTETDRCSLKFEGIVTSLGE